MKIGFIGCGNMGGAIMEGFIKSGRAAADDITIHTASQAKMKEISERLGVHAAASNCDITSACDLVVLAVKPYLCAQVLDEVSGSWRGEDQLVVSVVAGWSHAKLRGYIPEPVQILNIMPNTPCLVGEGVTAFNMDSSASKEKLAIAESLFGALGIVVYVHESQINAISGVCGCGPAYLYMAIEAMADGGVAMGLPRDTAIRIAAQAAVGAGKMVLETGQHPGALKDAVCSPGGATIRGVYALEKNGFRGGMMDAVIQSTEKMQEMSRD